MYRFLLWQAYHGQLIYDFQDGTLSINMNLKNCLVGIHDYDTKNVIKINYKYYYKISPYLDSNLVQTSAKFEKVGNSINIMILSEISDIDYCMIDLYIEKSNRLNQLEIDCDAYTNCILVQDSSQFMAIQIIIQNGNIFSNFKNVISNHLTYKSIKGLLQLNKFNIQSANININYGDIFLQSTNDLILYWTNQQQTFCFASPFFNHLNINNCYIANNGIS